MQAIETHEYARQWLETHGDKAVVVAAKRARSFEEKGNSEEATTWRKIEAAIKLMRVHDKAEASFCSGVLGTLAGG